MSLPTTYLGLIKPDEGEMYDVDLLNNNNDAIDTAIGTPYVPVPLTLSSGYGVRGSGFEDPQVYKDKRGMAHLEGSITNTGTITWTLNTTYDIATLPAGYGIAAGKAIEVPIMLRTGTTHYQGYVEIINISGSTKVRMLITATITSLAANGSTISLNCSWRAV